MKVVGLLKGLPTEVLGEGVGVLEGVGEGDLVDVGEGEGVGVGVGAGAPPPPPPPPPPVGVVATPVIGIALGARDLAPVPIMFTD